MDGERITLRLEPEDLELIDEFVKKRPEFTNRSQLARVAIRAFIEGAEGSLATDDNKVRVSIAVPKAVLGAMNYLVKGGHYSSIGAMIEEAIRKEYVNRDSLEEAKKRASEAYRNNLEYGI
jgi:metal-responsive CopG/Arc/MetJ family transcriptional regulator